MSQCLVVPKQMLESASFWPKLPRTEGVISAAILLPPSEIQELLEVINKNSVFMERKGPDGVEEKPEWQQIISYALIVQGNKFFLYQRGKTATYKEERLRSKISAGVGGHVEPSDASGFTSSLKREIEEEIRLSKNGVEIIVGEAFSKIKIIGYLRF